MSGDGALAALFDRAAREYDAERHMLVPCFEAFYAAGLAAVGDLPPGSRLLDLGAGTGLFAALVAGARPGLDVTLMDIAAGMLVEAKARFAGAGLTAPRIVVGDYSERLPDGPFHAAISAISIHHLETERKARVFRLIARHLAPDGRFVHAEQVLGETPAEEARLDTAWEAAARSLGASDEVITSARERMAHDRSETLERNLEMLAEAGLRNARATFVEGRFAVLVADAPG
ncbi:MAG: class I SAM-dependent methyltransferase [Pseudomonadota bacterium]